MKGNIIRLGIVYIIFLILGIVVLARIVDLQYFNVPSRDYVKKTVREDSTDGIRGNILAADGRYLAFSTPWYEIAMDVTVVDSASFYNNVEALASALSENFHEKSTKEYKNLLLTKRREHKQYVRLLKNPVSYSDMKLISGFPILENGRRRGGLITTKIDHRDYPYGKLAFRALGHLKNNQEKSEVGIEGAVDTILHGINGVRPMRLIEQNAWIPDVEREEIPPIDGDDVQISIDIDIQDITERALLRKIQNEENLRAGCAIVMEVATGEIKAMVNMEKDAKGNFSETFNYAIGELGEPGSVFKLATLVTLLEDKKVTLDTEMDAIVNWHYGNRILEDTYLRNYSKISVRKGLEISSNNVFRMLAAKHYAGNPQEFADKLKNDRKIGYNFKFDIKGFKDASIKGPDERKSWSPVDLPQMGMGYSVMVTPLHTLSFYNAIANDGVMVKPRLILNYQKNGEIKKDFPVETVGRVCSKETAALAKEALRGVVIGSNGTGRVAFKGCKVNVAGKTGTARINIPGVGYMDSQGRKMHQGTFVGFFPYENPKYTVIVVVYSKLTHQNFYGGTWGAPVVREIVDKIYADSPEWDNGIAASKQVPAIAQYQSHTINDTIKGIPSVMGMGLKEAVYTIESYGFTADITGNGKVIEQSPVAGTAAESGSHITIKLSQAYNEKN
ncbi:MAG: transpeptidase family protein [Bacteroidales bacterium]|nr:transpeptidase family protein [Bacteroidales bacterium]